MINHRRLVIGGTLIVLFLLAQPAFGKTDGLMRQAAGNFDYIERISAGNAGSGGGSYTAISASGRYVAFESAAMDIAPGVISGSWDVYLHDQQTDLFERQSTRSGGAAVYNPGDYTSPPSVSADGRFVAFMSRAENLVTNDANQMPDVFIHDRVANTTTLVSAARNGSSGNDASFTPVISADGRFVAFQSFASDLVLNDRNNRMDVFIRNIQSGATELVSVTDAGVQGSDFHDYGYPGLAVSADGRYVAFAYDNLPVSGSGASSPNIYLRDRQARTTRWVRSGMLPALSSDGRFLAFVTPEPLVPTDTEGGQDVYVLDRNTNQLERVSVTDSETAGSGADATFIQSPPSVSADGRFIAFETTSGLVPTDQNNLSDIYLRDRQSQTTLLVSASQTGEPGDGESHFPAMSADASSIAFASLAGNLITGDTNNLNDIFVFHRTLLRDQSGDHLLYFPFLMVEP